jgi:hypothetical protein
MEVVDTERIALIYTLLNSYTPQSLLREPQRVSSPVNERQESDNI